MDDDGTYIASERELWEDAIYPYKRRLLGLAERDSNFTGSRDDFADHSITVYGVGSPSQALRDVMEQAPADVHVRWSSVAHTRAEMLEAVEQVWRAVPEVVSSWIHGDPRFLDFQVDQDRVDEADLQRITAAIQKVAGVLSALFGAAS